jgi:hypothetical protein
MTRHHLRNEMDSISEEFGLGILGPQLLHT